MIKFGSVRKIGSLPQGFNSVPSQWGGFSGFSSSQMSLLLWSMEPHSIRDRGFRYFQKVYLSKYVDASLFCLGISNCSTVLLSKYQASLPLNAGGQLMCFLGDYERFNRASQASAGDDEHAFLLSNGCFCWNCHLRPKTRLIDTPLCSVYSVPMPCWQGYASNLKLLFSSILLFTPWLDSVDVGSVTYWLPSFLRSFQSRLHWDSR